MKQLISKFIGEKPKSSFPFTFEKNWLTFLVQKEELTIIVHPSQSELLFLKSESEKGTIHREVYVKHRNKIQPAMVLLINDLESTIDPNKEMISFEKVNIKGWKSTTIYIDWNSSYLDVYENLYVGSKPDIRFECKNTNVRLFNQIEDYLL